MTTKASQSTWWICGLLLCASSINYMDRLTLSVLSKQIKSEFSLSNEQFGNVELAFGIAFAVGSTVFGIIADRVNIRLLYPVVLLLWSLMGFLTGYVESYAGLILCRTLLGFFEAGHWPCALITTHRLLPAESRTFGNSLLQSGTAIGSIVTPLIMMLLVKDESSWRLAFQAIAVIGVFWVLAWEPMTRNANLAPLSAAEGQSEDSSDTLLSVVFSQKFLVLVAVVFAINACWHVLRVWMPLFLQSGRGFDQQQMFLFMFLYYSMNDIGCLSAGFLSRKLHQNGFSVFASRSIVFGICAVLAATGGLIPWLSGGPGLFVVLMLVAMGSLGLFPCYYSFSQEMSSRHKGKVLGLLGTIAWLTSSPLHPIVGRWADKTKSYDLGLALGCGLPILALFVLVLVWPANKVAAKYNPEGPAA